MTVRVGLDMDQRDRPVRISAVWAAAVLGAILGVTGLVLKIDQDHHSRGDVIVNGAGGYLLLTAGIVAHVRRPGNRMGLLMVLAAAGFFAEDLQLSSTPWVTSVGMLLSRSSSGFLAHLVLAFPSGQ